MTMNAISSVVNQINHQAQQVKSAGAFTPIALGREETAPAGFADILKNSLNGINSLQTEGKQQAANFMAGVGDVGLNDVMVSLQKSSIALNLGVQVRNKMVTAYQEIMNMAV